MCNEGMVAISDFEPCDCEWLASLPLPGAVVEYSRSGEIDRGLVEDW